MINFHDVNRRRSPLDPKRMLGKLVRLPLKLIPRNAVLPILQGPGRGLKWVVGSYNHGCWLGSYEFEKQLVLRDLVKPGDVVYDIGAHVGYFTIIFSKLVGPKGRVIAFEPFKENVDWIKRHADLNRMTNIEVVQAGIGGQTGDVSFAKGWHSATGGMTAEGDQKFKVLKLTDFIELRTAPIPQLIKFDIEGAEQDAIPAAINFLVKSRVRLLISTHSDTITKNLGQLLASHGYRVTPLQWSNRPAQRTPDNATLLQAVL
jgi:FkbM family methyltransferase